MTTFAHKTQNVSSTVNPINCKLVLDFFSESLSTHTHACACTYLHTYGRWFSNKYIYLDKNVGALIFGGRTLISIMMQSVVKYLWNSSFGYSK